MLNRNGYSQLELLVTLAIVFIVIGGALPSLRQLVVSNHQTAHINNFVSSILLARSTAATINRYTIVCPSQNLIQCQPEADWNEGWVVMSNSVHPSNSNFLETAELLRVQHPDPEIIVNSNRSVYLFRPFGKRATNGTVVFCHQDPAIHAKAIIVSYNGRGRLSDSYSNGNPLSCDA